MNSYLESAIEAKEKKKKKPNTKLPMHEFIHGCANQPPQWYGTAIINKMIEELSGMMFKTPAKEKAGDGYILVKRSEYNHVLDRYLPMEYLLTFEGKVSFTDNKMGKKHRITHVRPWHNVDVFTIILVDQEDYFKIRCYVLPKDYIVTKARGAMNNTKDENEHNKFVDMSFTIDKEDAYREFGQRNLLKGTSYNDLKDYVQYLSNSSVSDVKPTEKGMSVNPIVNAMGKVNHRTTYSKRVKFAIEVNGKIIEGKTNRETIIMFANYMSPMEAIKFFPECWLSFRPYDVDKFKNVKLQTSNLYLNPRLSIRDLRSILKNGNKRSKLNVRIIEK